MNSFPLTRFSRSGLAFFVVSSLSLTSLGGCAGGLSGLKATADAISEPVQPTTVLDRLDQAAAATKQVERIMTSVSLRDPAWIKAAGTFGEAEVGQIHGRIRQGYDYANAPKVRVLPVTVLVEWNDKKLTAEAGTGVLGALATLGDPGKAIAANFDKLRDINVKKADREGEIAKLDSQLDDNATLPAAKPDLKKQLEAAKKALDVLEDDESKAKKLLVASIDALLVLPAGSADQAKTIALAVAYAHGVAVEATLATRAVIVQAPQFISMDKLKLGLKHIVKKLIAETLGDMTDTALQSFLDALSISIETSPSLAVKFTAGPGAPMADVLPKLGEALKGRAVALVTQIKGVPSKVSTVATKLGFYTEVSEKLAKKLSGLTGTAFADRMDDLVSLCGKLDDAACNAPKPAVRAVQ